MRSGQGTGLSVTDENVVVEPAISTGEIVHTGYFCGMGFVIRRGALIRPGDHPSGKQVVGIGSAMRNIIEPVASVMTSAVMNAFIVHVVSRLKIVNLPGALGGLRRTLHAPSFSPVERYRPDHSRRGGALRQ